MTTICAARLLLRQLTDPPLWALAFLVGLPVYLTALAYFLWNAYIAGDWGAVGVFHPKPLLSAIPDIWHYSWAGKLAVAAWCYSILPPAVWLGRGVALLSRR